MPATDRNYEENWQKDRQREGASTKLRLGTEEAVSRVPMYQEAFLREHGEEPRTFRAMEFLFHRRGNGMVTGLAVFRPLLPRYVPLFQALSIAEPKDD